MFGNSLVRVLLSGETLTFFVISNAIYVALYVIQFDVMFVVM